MTPDQAILAVLATVPERTVRGKKRLQKLVHLWQASGVEINASFKIRYYGPFSREIEDACTILSLFGDVEEKEVSTGYANYLTTEFSLPSDAHVDLVEVKDSDRATLVKLNEFSTVELEVASTIVFFMKTGLSFEKSIEETRKMKPTKVNDITIRNAREITTVVEAN